jgi:hypothetical protein
MPKPKNDKKVGQKIGLIGAKRNCPTGANDHLTEKVFETLWIGETFFLGKAVKSAFAFFFFWGNVR